MDSEATHTLFFSQELGFCRKILDHVEGKDADDDCKESFEDEDPPPAFQATNSVHLRKGHGERGRSLREITTNFLDSGSQET